MSDNPGPGHNSEVGGVSADRLRSLVSRYENLEGEIRERREDQKDLMKEVKSSGFEPRVVRQLLRIRARDPKQVEEDGELLALYQHAMGE